MEKIIIHHSGNHNTKELIYDLHVNQNKWESIGYHFLISKEGKLEKTRDLSKQGAHCLGQNNSIGICLLGNLDIDQPTKEQILALNNLIKELKIKDIKLHRDYSDKSCPGKNFKREMVNDI